MGCTDEYVSELLDEIAALHDREAMLLDTLCIARDYMPVETALVRNEVVQVDIALVADAFTVCAESVAAWKQKIIDAAFGEPVASVASSGQFNFPILQWKSANTSLETPIGTELYRKPEVKP